MEPAVRTVLMADTFEHINGKFSLPDDMMKHLETNSAEGVKSNGTSAEGTKNKIK